MKICLWSILSLFLLGALYQSLATKVDERRAPPPGELVDVGGYKLHLHSMGTGEPTVVLDAGLGAFSSSWGLVQPEIAKFTRVVSYDRAGLGWSERSPNPRTSLEFVHELHALLHKANIPGPYILVGHSLGGGNAQLFTATYPDEVAGLVLVDSCHGQQEKRVPPFSSLWLSALRNPPLVRAVSSLGIPRLFPTQFLQIIAPTLPASLSEIHQVQCVKTNYCFTAAQEGAQISQSLREIELAQSSKFAEKPCIVITAGMAMPGKYWEEFHRAWNILQKELVAKFPLSKQIIADRSDHMIPWAQPEIVVQAVQDLLKTSE